MKKTNHPETYIKLSPFCAFEFKRLWHHQKCKNHIVSIYVEFSIFQIDFKKPAKAHDSFSYERDTKPHLIRTPFAIHSVETDWPEQQSVNW